MRPAQLRKSHGFALWRALAMLSLSTVASFGQGKPPASAVPEPYRQKFVQYADRRTVTEKALNLIGLTSRDVGQSFALIAGVSRYPNLPQLERELPAATADIDQLQDYLRHQEFFDEIVVLRDGDVTLENLEYFLQNYFPERLRRSPKSRFLFAYSGHGMAEGARENPTGYLLKSTARSLNDKQHSINLSVLRVYLDQVIGAGYQTLSLINACYSGAFLSRRPFGDAPGQRVAGGAYFPKNGGAHAITAGGSNQLSWHDPKFGKGSVFFEKLLAGLGGQADVFPIYPDGHRGDGVITVDEIATYLREEVSLATNQSQIPIPADLALNRSLGGFFFLNRQKMIANGVVPAWNPKRATPFGMSAEQMLIAARKYYAEHQYREALPLFQEAVQAGSAQAALHVGIMYANGQGGLPEDEAQAVNWYRKAAEAGNTDAMHRLGEMYQEGRGGLPEDEAQAAMWYRKAAEGGQAGAMTALGLMYVRGSGGLPEDDVQAVNWWRKAAAGGDPEAMLGLGIMYESGRGGLAKDDAQAVSWYRKAGDRGDTDGMNALGRMYLSGRGGLPEDAAQAVIWYRKAADAGDANGMNNLGLMYEYGSGGLPKDNAEAVSWYRKAARAGDAHAMNNLGLMYEYGRGGLAKDDAQAVSWYRKAAEGGHADGMANLAFMYKYGRGGLPKDDAQAVGWYRKAAEDGNAAAMNGLAAMYEYGRGGLAKDDAQAASWYRKAAEGGDTAGMTNLAYMYEEGRGGLPKDDRQAVSWYRKAAELGNTRAMNELGRSYEDGRGGLAKDDAQAVSWYRKAAEGGNAAAMFNVGFYYENGRGGLPKDGAEAVNWYRKAAQLGNRDAEKELKRLGR